MALIDKMSMGDKQIKMALNCAQCGQAVESGQPHECKSEDKNNASCSGTPDSDSA